MVVLTKRDILAHRDEIIRLAHLHGAVAIRLFGSVARDEADATSDIDFLVIPAPITPPFFPGGLIVALEDLLRCEVQITLDSPPLNARLRQTITRDLVVL